VYINVSACERRHKTYDETVFIHAPFTILEKNVYSPTFWDRLCNSQMLNNLSFDKTLLQSPISTEQPKHFWKLGRIFFRFVQFEAGHSMLPYFLTKSCQIQHHTTEPCKVPYYQAQPSWFIIFREKIFYAPVLLERTSLVTDL